MLALQPRPTPAAQPSYASMLVAFSRTHTTEELRLFMPNGGGHEALSYLTGLRPSPYIDLYFLGHQDNQDRWGFHRIYELTEGDSSVLKGS